MNDEELVDWYIYNEWREKDLFFTELYKRYYNIVYWKCFLMLNHEHDAEDATLVIMSKVFENIGRFNKESKFSTWLHSITNNHCIDSIRRKKNKVTYFHNAPIVAKDAAIIETKTGIEDLWMHLNAHIADNDHKEDPEYDKKLQFFFRNLEIKPWFSQIMRLKLYELKYEDIAEILKIALPEIKIDNKDIAKILKTRSLTRMEHKDIAKILEKSESAIKMHAKRGKLALEQRFLIESKKNGDEERRGNHPSSFDEFISYMEEEYPEIKQKAEAILEQKKSKLVYIIKNKKKKSLGVTI